VFLRAIFDSIGCRSGEDAGDLSTLVNPEAVQAIRAARR
jgi:hypothetical protein